MELMTKIRSRPIRQIDASCKVGAVQSLSHDNNGRDHVPRFGAASFRDISFQLCEFVLARSDARLTPASKRGRKQKPQSG